jgi:hypothetical protein
MIENIFVDLKIVLYVKSVPLNSQLIDFNFISLFSSDLFKFIAFIIIQFFEIVKSNCFKYNYF